ncbi:phasin family protein [Noviherbaspirillum sp.]|uniref:phasin family protein n=1 Tax=Noviherbaspirillum sp. TaxID=1926288 RepID=UPI002B4686A4|nr:phasin family protein [Noviherbaspirillum sp.]HJV82257.1 phasin family protein [Noviherbaspirillum sp.]
MFTIPEQFSAASKANLEAQLALLTNLTNKTFEGVEKMLDLNLNVARASLEESSAAAKQFLSAKDPQEWIAVAAAQAQPNAEKALSYGRHLATIASGVQAEFNKATEAQIAETSRKMLELVEEVTKNAPAGTENAVALLKSAIGNANAGYEQLSKSTKQAVEVLESNLNNAVGQFAQAAPKAASRASKK